MKDVFKKSGYNVKLIYKPDATNNINNSNKRKRKRNIIMVQSPI